MTAELQQILYIVSAALIIIGLLGVFLPVLPGIPLAFVGMVLAVKESSLPELRKLADLYETELTELGTADGSELGAAVGAAVGCGVGESVGEAVGA